MLRGSLCTRPCSPFKRREEISRQYDGWRRGRMRLGRRPNRFKRAGRNIYSARDGFMKPRAYHQRARNRFTNYLSRLSRRPASFCVRRNGLDGRRNRLYTRRGRLDTRRSRLCFSGMDFAFAGTNSTRAAAVSTRECVCSTRAGMRSTDGNNVSKPKQPRRHSNECRRGC